MKPGKMPMGMGGFNMNAIMKQAQEMQNNIAKKQEELSERQYSASSGGGAVCVTVKNKLVESIKIQPSAIDPEDPEMLEDLVRAAVNSALEESSETEKNEMQAVAGGMNLPF